MRFGNPKKNTQIYTNFHNFIQAYWKILSFVWFFFQP